MEKLEIFWQLPKCDTETGSEQMLLGNAAYRFVHCRVLSSVQPLSRVWLFVTLWTAAHQASLSPTISRSWPKFMFIASVMQSSHLIRFSFCPQSCPASGTFPMSHLFTSDDHDTGASASTSVFPVHIQGWSPLRLAGRISLLSKGLSGTQHHSSKASILWHSAFFMVQLSQLHTTTGKSIVWSIWTFVSRVASLLFSTLSRCVITLLSASNCILISWLQSLSAVILEPKKRKSVTTSTFSPLFAMKSWDWRSWS